MIAAKLSPEILLLVAEQLASDSDQPSLSALSLANRQFAQICKVARYRVWDISNASKSRLEEYLLQPTWLEHVRHLRLPLVDPHSRIHHGECVPPNVDDSSTSGFGDAMETRKQVMEYDLSLSAVIRSVKQLRSLEVVLGCPGFDPNSPSTLYESCKACSSLEGLAFVHIANLLTIDARRIAVQLLRNIRAPRHISFCWAEWYWVHTSEEVEHRREIEARRATAELKDALYSRESRLDVQLCDNLFYD